MHVLADEVTKLVSSIASGLLLLSRSQEPSPDGNKGCNGSCQVLFKGFENLWIDFAEEYFFNELERVLSLLRGACRQRAETTNHDEAISLARPELLTLLKVAAACGMLLR